MKKVPKEWIPTIPDDVDEQINDIQEVIDAKAIGMTNPLLFVGIGRDGHVIWDVKDCNEDGVPKTT